MTIRWNLPKAMYEKGVFSAAELGRLLREKASYDISAPAIHRLVKGLPVEVKFATIDALCEALDCGINDIITRQAPTQANMCVQPLVLASGFVPPKRQAKKKKKQEFSMDMPPI